MKTFHNIYLILILSLQIKMMESSTEINFFTQILRNIIQRTESHEIIMVIDDIIERGTSLFEKLCVAVLRILPTRIILASSGNNLLSSSVSSYGLLLFVYSTTNYTAMQNTSAIYRSLVYRGHDSMVLLIVLDDMKENNTSFEPHLRTMWKNRILDVTVLQISTSNGDTTSSAIVHYFNPFNNVYFKENYTCPFEWFPNKLADMHGYPLRVDMMMRPPHSVIVRDTNGRPIRNDAPDGRTLRTISRVMNFSIVPYPRHGGESMIVKLANGTVIDYYDKLENGEVDMVATTVPYVNDTRGSLAHLRSMSTEKWCVMVPMRYSHNTFSLYSFLGVAFASVFIVTVFWLTSILLKFEKRPWRPFALVSIMLSVSVTDTPRRMQERIVFLAILLVSFMYASNFFAELMHINLNSDVPIRYKSFEDLERSGLVPMVEPTLFNISLAYSEGALLRLKKKAIFFDDCPAYLMKYRNVSCFMEWMNAISKIFENSRQTKKFGMMLTGLCYWSPQAGFMFDRFSPFKERVSNIIERLHEVGIRGTWYIQHFGNQSRKQVDEDNGEIEKEEPQGLRNQLIFVALCGYSFSVVVLMIEIAFNFWKHQKHGS